MSISISNNFPMEDIFSSSSTHSVGASTINAKEMRDWLIKKQQEIESHNLSCKAINWRQYTRVDGHPEMVNKFIELINQSSIAFLFNDMRICTNKIIPKNVLVFINERKFCGVGMLDWKDAVLFIMFED